MKRHYKDEKNIQKIYQNISYWFFCVSRLFLFSSHLFSMQPFSIGVPELICKKNIDFTLVIRTYACYNRYQIMSSVKKWSSAEKGRSCCLDVFCEKGIFSNFAKFTGKHLCQGLFLIKLQTAGCRTLWNIYDGTFLQKLFTTKSH